MNADIKEVRLDAVIAGLKPPPILTLSEWADEHYRLTVESSAAPGRWKTLPYQVEIMDAMSSPLVTDVTLMKSARVGYTLMISAAVGYFVHQAPCSILFAQPTVEDAKSFSKDTIAPMIRDVPVLAAVMRDEADDKGPKGSDNTIQGKRYPGGRLSLIGANSGAGFRRRSCKVFIGDEVDAWPESAGSDGDPVSLGKKRTEYFWDRKHFLGSTPLVEGHSRIESSFKSGDQRRYHVPCPHCGAEDYLVFSKKSDGPGHHMRWPEGRPQDAYFECSANGCLIEHKDKREMVTAGRWVAAQPFTGHASFHIWAAYSFSPNATWGHIAQEFLKAKSGGRETLRTFVNTALGEVFRESGDAPDWERLYQLREHYPMATVPDGVKILTCGVDVQKDRVVYEVVGWGLGRESWSIDAGVIPFDTSNEADWAKLDLLNRSYPSTAGLMTVRMLAIDSGFNTQMVYQWARRYVGRVIAIKGTATSRTLVSSPTPVDVTHNGRRIARGCKVWPLGVDIAKNELYGWLRLQPPTKESGLPYPDGFCHFPEHGEDFFKQLTGEHLVSSTKRTGYAQHEWQMIPGRENHYLDARVYARAAAFVCGADRMGAKPAPAPEVPPPALPPVAPPAAPAPPRVAPVSDSRFQIRKDRGTRSWFAKNR